VSAPTITVDVALGLAGPTDFVLDDPTRGVLDGTTYVLSSGYTDVTSSSVTASITRGRFSQLWDAADAGHASVRLNNEDRDFDPAHMPSPYAGFIVPGREVQISANDVPVYTGIIDDWDLEYEVGGRSVAVMKTVDTLGVLGKLQFDAWTSSGVRAEQKLSAVVNRPEVGLGATPTSFDAGSETLQADSVTWGSNALNYCQLIARSDLGLFFAAADGTLTFRNREAIGGTSQATFSDNGTDIPYQSISATIGSELLFARVGVDREGGSAQSATVDDTTVWKDLFGPLRSLTLTGLLLDSDAASLALAEYLLLLYDTPRYRISEIEVLLHALTSPQQATVLAVDIGDVVTVSFQPNDTGDQITQPLMVQGIRHEISPSIHRMFFSFTDGSEPFFRLDDTTYGVLDDDRLAF
jgi:hypothetical protein